MSDPVTYPELIFGIAGPIGVDVDGLNTSLSECLEEVGYESLVIKLTTEMMQFNTSVQRGTDGLFAEYSYKMDYANALRKHYKNPDTLGRIAISAIRRLRKSKGGEGGDADKPLQKHAYIIRQLKHPEEVRLLRKVYGAQFILVSAYAPEDIRKRKLIEDIQKTESTQLPKSEIEHRAGQLIERDASETGESWGQQLRDTFHLADVFVDGANINDMKAGLTRFIHALFGKNDITPRKDEYGMYAAKSASLRSADLSRQVGAAIFSSDGELVTQGCNEVPKASGGTYWDNEDPDFRDIRKGFDPNDRQKRELLRDLIERLRVANLLSTKALEWGNDTTIVSNLLEGTEEKGGGALAQSWMMDITEFGRVVHAEMCSICDAARLGKSVKGCTLFCTTFPCHNCTKHIIAAGISRVVYMEPYPKSRAKELHKDEIQLETEADPKRVSFVPFMGISPFRYRNIFQKGKRKLSDGTATKWLDGNPRPMIDIEFPTYTTAGEPWALVPFMGEVHQTIKPIS
jgi:deoxycytidylate deaminase